MIPNVSRREILGYAAASVTGVGGTAVAKTSNRARERRQPDCEHHIVFTADPGDRIEYQFTVSGTVEHSDDAGASPLSDDEVTIDDQNHIEGSTARGIVGGAGDAYCFSGEIVSGTMSGDADVYLDGGSYGFPPEGGGGVGDSGDSNPSGCDHHIVIDGERDDRVYYQFTVSGSADYSEDSGAAPLSDEEVTIDDQNHVEGSTVRGVVTEWADAYCFTGDIVTGAISAHAAMYLDGQPYEFVSDVNESVEVEFLDCDTVRIRTNTDIEVDVVWTWYDRASPDGDPAHRVFQIAPGAETFRPPQSIAVIDRVNVYLLPDRNRIGEIINYDRAACHDEAERACC